MKKGRLLFWIIFFGAAGVVAAIPEFMTDSAPAVAPVSRPAPLTGLHAEAAAASAPAEPGDSTPPPIVADGSDLFAVKSWYVAPPPPPPPPPPAPPPPPPPPAAPPLPFKFIGQFDDASSLKAFLQRNEKVYAVGVGDIIEGTYRVAGINAGQMTLIYLPLNIPQTISAGSPL